MKSGTFEVQTRREMADSDPRLLFQFTSLFSAPSEYCANPDSQFTTLLFQARKSSLDAQPFALRPVHNIILCPQWLSCSYCRVFAPRIFPLGARVRRSPAVVDIVNTLPVTPSAALPLR